MDMTMDSIRVPAAVIRVAMMMMSTTPGMRIWQKISAFITVYCVSS
jgi:hypothetical protein